jgi:hypothetical protein
MSRRPTLRLFACTAALLAVAAPTCAITIKIDYTYDTTNYFGSGNPQGATAGSQARAALESAAGFFSAILDDTFSAINVPGPYPSSVSTGGVVFWSWEQQFEHPVTGNTVSITDPAIPADQFIVFAGARSLPGITAGIGAVGGYSWRTDIMGNNQFTPTDIDLIEQTTTTFESAVERRGEPTGFGRWGGAISFDTNPGAAWHYNHTTAPAGNVTDFYSVALHELAHALGIGEDDTSGLSSWERLVSGSSFLGGNAQSQHGGNPVPLSADSAHWANGTMSVVYGGSASQEAAMDPDVQNGMRKGFTELDAAAMKDIGWDVVPLPGTSGDYNNNGVVDAADYVAWRNRLNQLVNLPNDATPGSVTSSDYALWRTNFGRMQGTGSAAPLAAVPEPAAAVLTLICGVGALFARRKRRG